VADLPASVTVHSFDHLYETADSFNQVYEQIIGQLLQWGREREIVYAVPGHPFMGEATVTGLMTAATKERLAITVLPGLSFMEPVLSVLQLDGLDGLQLFDAIELATFHYPP
jgi:tetrapyrrole methylase family protein/MazG family protein